MTEMVMVARARAADGESRGNVDHDASPPKVDAKTIHRLGERKKCYGQQSFRRNPGSSRRRVLTAESSADEFSVEFLMEEVSIVACAACTDGRLVTTAMNSLLDEAWRLSPSVALRPEPFGALAYHFGNRKLTLLK